MTFHLPTRIVFGPGVIAELSRLMKTLRATRPFLVTDRGIVAAGLIERVRETLAGVPVFGEVETNPKHSTVNRAGDWARAVGPDLIIGLGGGSVLDAAKAAALLATNPGGIEDYEGRGKYRAEPLPVLAIPTTCGTGSEVTWVSVITHADRKWKMSIKGPEMFPRVALVDPDLLATLPPPLVASTGLDALTHAIEAATSKRASFLTDILAREALGLIFGHLRSAYQDIRRNSQAREKLMLGSVLAGMAFGNSDVGAVHCLAESLGGLYDIPHGVACAVVLPWVIEFNLEAAEDQYAEIARVVGLEADGRERLAATLIREIRDLRRALSIPAFRELGIREADFVLIAQRSFENNSNPSNVRQVTAADYLDILHRASSAGF